MDILNNVYMKNLADNEATLQFWDDYLKKLEALNFEVFSKQMRIPALIPIGSRTLFRGNLIHTNEIFVALGLNYFVKCSTTQADELRRNRIKSAQEKIIALKREKEYLENQVLTKQERLLADPGHDIFEPYIEEDETLWREKHKQNVKKHKRRSMTNDRDNIENMKDEDLWNQLDELELQEELENEFEKLSKKDEQSHYLENIDVNLKSQSHGNATEVSKTDTDGGDMKVNDQFGILDNATNTNIILNDILNKQSELERRLHELKLRNREGSYTEEGLLERLDEIEELNLIEDEMDRLDNVLHDESETESVNMEVNPKNKRRVLFAEEDDSETIEINFSHSNLNHDTQPYSPTSGIVKPSDIYDAYSNLFEAKRGTVSILKSTRNSIHSPQSPENSYNIEIQQPIKSVETIVIKDVLEKNNLDHDTKELKERPPSIFKIRRQQQRKQ